jgi:hypothetical protein
MVFSVKSYNVTKMRVFEFMSDKFHVIFVYAIERRVQYKVCKQAYIFDLYFTIA